MTVFRGKLKDDWFREELVIVVVKAAVLNRRAAAPQCVVRDGGHFSMILFEKYSLFHCKYLILVSLRQ